MKARMSPVLEEILKNSATREMLRNGLRRRDIFELKTSSDKAKVKAGDNTYMVQLVNRKG